jgi:hypothetical protein
MSIALRREYLEILRSRYRGANRRGRSQIIDELVLNTGLHRKSAIRCLRHSLRPKRPGWGRKKLYSPDCIQLLRRIWKLSDQLCSKKLKCVLPDWIQRLGAVPRALAEEVCRMSAASIDRYLGPYRAFERRKSNTGTRPGSRIFRQVIPLKSLGNIAPCAGYLEADTVAHCGGNMAGDFIWSLTITDTFSGWTENRAVWGKHSKNVFEAIEDIENCLPFELRSINVDNGSEIMNHRLVEYFQQGGKKKRERFVMTRSRSYRKNDNAHVEQKNWTHVRQIFGYERFEFKEMLPIMNEVYKVQNQLTNFFHPQFKLKSKVRVGTKIKKTYHAPETPYRRLLADPKLPQEQKDKLTALFNILNPLDLRERREALLAYFFRLKRELQSNQESKDSGPSESPSPGNISH